MKIISRTLLVLLLALSFSACSASKPQQAQANASENAQADGGASATASSTASNAGAESGARVEGQTYRGILGKNSIEMKLRRDGENLSGTYFYEGIGQDLTLKGRVDSRGTLSLQEFDASGKQTGKFACKLTNESDQEPAAKIEGDWSKPDGSAVNHVSLTEQHVEFNGPSHVVSKTIKERKPSINASYPQLTGGNDPAIAKFNERAQAIITKAIKEFKEGEPDPERSDLSINYNVMLATDDLISVEFLEDSYAGGAHPDSTYYTLNYDLRASRELQLKEMFKPNADYKKAIRQYALKDINARAKKEAEQEHLPPDQQTDELFSQDQLSDWTGWTMTRRGILVYFDLPHAVAFFSREFIPTRVIKDQLDPQKAVMK
ncbi:MAG: hypothetical protein QOD00_259 [Blastocatellia bacterium]|jgi:hypothetical protein|nr:hypothetical protein [Blastocatellia bacterium]